MKPLYGAIALTALGILIWGGGMLSQPEVRIVQQGQQTQSVDHGSVQGSVTTGGEESLPDIRALKTFRGASVDGQLRTDLHGNLIIDKALKRWIDFYLSARGEIPLADIVAAMHAEMAMLIQPGQDQAVDLLEDYLGYLAALGEYDEETSKRINGGDMDSLLARMEWQQRLRREWLAPEVVEAFFADDEAMDSYTLEKIRIAREGGDAATMANAEQQLPEEIREMRERSHAVVNMRKTEDDMRAAGAGDSEIQAWRVEKYGAEAAGRLAKVDQQRAQWNQRLREYKEYSDSLALQGLAETDRERLLQAYKNRHFDDNEIKRLPAALSLLAADE